MKAVKAAEFLEKYLVDYVHRLDPDFDVAVSLALKALKRHIDRDYLPYSVTMTKLEGED